MKAYLYDPESGLYEGETFAETATLGHESGLTSIPPPDYRHGQVPFFDRRTKSWEVIPISVARQLLGGRTGSTPEKQS